MSRAGTDMRPGPVRAGELTRGCLWHSVRLVVPVVIVGDLRLGGRTRYRRSGPSPSSAMREGMTLAATERWRPGALAGAAPNPRPAARTRIPGNTRILEG